MTNFTLASEKLRSERRVWLVTGAAGFIGSHLIENLLALNQTVIGLDNFSTGYRKNIQLAERAALKRSQEASGTSHTGSLEVIEGDICDLQTCCSACENVDYVLHQAALGSIPRSIEDPITTNLSNVTGFLNMLTASKNAGVKRFVYAASSSTYGDHSSLPKVEEQIGTPLSPYAVTKLVNELYANVFGKVYKAETIGLRYFNVFGQRQDPSGAYAAVIPKWLNAMINNQPVFINGDGSTSRDFCFVDNAVQANILAATTKNKEAVNQIYNVAAGKRTSLTQLFAALQQQLCPHLPHVGDLQPQFRDFRSGDVLHSQADISKAKRLLGYQPSHDFYGGISELAPWFLENTGRENPTH